VTAREIGRVTIAEALELTALVARKQPHRYGRFAARWLCLWRGARSGDGRFRLGVFTKERSKLRYLAVERSQHPFLRHMEPERL
jgi:hypothetical protein